MDNPYAFPVPGHGYHSFDRNSGMTLRDWFASTAPEPSADSIELQERLDRAKNPHNDSYKPRIRSRLEVIAALRYAYADAMLTERNRHD